MKLTAEQVERVQALERGGRLSAIDVLEDAQDVDSPLHTLFEWDSERAAFEYRLAQAREVVRGVQIVVTRNTISISAPRYIPDPSRPGNRAGYMATSDVAADATLKVEAVIVEINRALGVLRRAERVAFALNEAPDLAAITSDLMAVRDRLATGGAAQAAAQAV